MVAASLTHRLRASVNSRVLTLMLGHFTVDTYAGITPVLYPLLIQRFHVDLFTVGFVTLAYSGTASVSQPLFGWLADRYGTRLTGVTMMWTALTYSALGFAPSFPVLVGMACLAGLGSGCFHPFGALNVSAALGPRQRSTGMSVYVTGGTLGVALGPLVGVAAFYLLGIRGTAVLVIPGLVIGLFLLRQLRGERRAAGRIGGDVAAAVPWALMAVVVVVMMSRTWTVYVLETFTPTWYAALGYSAAFYAPLATTIVLCSAAGTVGAGGLADRYGRKAVLVATLVFSVPVVFAFGLFTGPIAFLTGALVGLLAASTGPLLLLMAQQLMSRRAGLASGLIMGIGFVTGAIGVPITGAVADRWGLQFAMELQVVVVLATIPLALALPSEARLRSVAGGQVDQVAQRQTGPEALEVVQE